MHMPWLSGHAAAGAMHVRPTGSQHPPPAQELPPQQGWPAPPHAVQLPPLPPLQTSVGSLQ
jgi:hypothetical protein